MKQVDVVQRAPARGLVDAMFNGEPPFTDKEAKENKIYLNCNWGEGADKLLQGRQQLENAFLSTGNFFSIRVPDAPISKRQTIEGILTDEANRPLKKGRRSLEFLHTQREKWGSVALHGRGITMWADDDDPIPFFVAIPDLLVPTDTEITFSNLNYFAVRRRMKPGQLFRKTIAKGDKVDPGWQLNKVRKILAQYKDQNLAFQNVDPYTQPERWNEVFKQNLIWWDSDVAPTIMFWDFYFSEDNDPQGAWRRGIILDSDCIPSSLTTDNPIDWVYQPSGTYAKSLGQIIHIQFADGNNVPPFMYHSCRGMGTRLYDTVMMLNRYRCQSLQKMFEDLVPWFQVNDPSDKARLEQFSVGMAYGIVPPGLGLIPKEQRPSPEPQFMEMTLSSLKQLLGEGSVGYVQDIDTGTNKERTATEVNALMHQDTNITSSMLNIAYLQEGFSDEEVCRRLAKKNTHNFTSKRFQANVLDRFEREGIGKKWLNSELWMVEHERVLGGGNSQLEMAQSQALFNARQAWSPSGQAIVANRYAFSITHDPALAKEIAPTEDANKITNSVHDTEMAFNAMMGSPVPQPLSLKSGINPIDACNTMIGLMESTAQGIMAQGGVGAPQQVLGLGKCNAYVMQFIQLLAEDKNNKELVKGYTDRLGRVMNLVKSFAQRQQQMQKSQMNGNGANGVDPSKMVKAQFDQQAGQQKLVQKQQSHQQKMQQNAQKFAAQQSQEKARTLNQISLETAKGVAASRTPQKPTPFEEE